MNTENPTIKVVSEIERDFVVEISGDTKKYYLDPIRTMHLQVRSLRVSKNAMAWGNGPNGEPDSLPELSLVVSGVATIAKGTISVIGDLTSRTDILNINFRALDADGRKSRDERASEKGIPPRYTGVSVGFIRHDWEIGNDDEWFIECYVSSSNLEAIASEIRAHQLSTISVGLSLRDIYTDDDWAPPSQHADWFLRPNRRDNTIESPEMANGDISRLGFELKYEAQEPEQQASDTIDKVRKEDTPEDFDTSESHAALADSPVSAEATAVYALASNVERLRSTISRYGALAIALVIAFFIFK